MSLLGDQSAKLMLVIAASKKEDQLAEVPRRLI